MRVKRTLRRWWLEATHYKMSPLLIITREVNDHFHERLIWSVTTIAAFITMLAVSFMQSWHIAVILLLLWIAMSWFNRTKTGIIESALLGLTRTLLGVGLGLIPKAVFELLS